MLSKISIFIKQYFVPKQYKILLFGLIIISLFSEKAIQLYNRFVVSNILSHANDKEFISDVMTIAVTIITTVLFVRYTRRKYSVSNNLFFTSLLVLPIYFYFRFVSDRYYFYNFSISNKLAYTDYLLVLLPAIITIRILNLTRGKTINKNSNTFIIDAPLMLSKGDLFERTKYAIEISQKIQNYSKESRNSLAIGIVGSWGVGKTTFSHMICESLDSENCIVIHYNPWRSQNPTKIMEDYFEIISSELKKYNPTLSVSLREYVKQIIEIEENIYTKTSRAIVEMFEDKSNTNDIYNKINNAIAEIKMPVVVVIDDLDRRDKLEIIEVLRLIRNTANFGNFTYIVCYDREYVLEAVKSFNPYNHKLFLEKIFQFEFTLPLPTQQIIQSELKRLINENTNHLYEEFVESTIGSKANFNIDFTKETIKTYRDVIRLANSLCFEINIIKNDVYFPDFYLLQILKLKYRAVYDLLHQSKDLLFITDADDNGSIIFRLRAIKHKWLDVDLLPASLHSVDAAKIRRENRDDKDPLFLDSSLSQLNKNYSDHDKDIIKSLINTLLIIKRSDNPKLNIDLYKSFAYIENYYKYFAFRLEPKDIPAEEFENYRQKEFTDYKTKILEWIGDGNLKQVNDRLQKINAFTSKHEYGNHVMATMLIGRTYFVEERESNFNYLRLLMEYPLKQTHLFDTISEAALFLSKIFYDAETPALYESLYITGLIHLVVNRNYYCILKRKNLVDINVHYLYDYCRKNNELSDNFFQLYRNTIVKIDNNFSIKEKHPKAEEIYHDYIKKNLRAEQLGLFIDYTKVNKEKYCRLNKEEVKDIFGGIDDFVNYLYSSTNIVQSTLEFKEFMTFLENAKKSDYSNFYFDFKHLQTQGKGLSVLIDATYENDGL